jgi:hypothetical protein
MFVGKRERRRDAGKGDCSITFPTTREELFCLDNVAGGLGAGQTTKPPPWLGQCPKFPKGNIFAVPLIIQKWF